LFDEGSVSKNDVQNADKLCIKFKDIFPVEPPSLLHGDLWSGNFTVAKNKAGDAVPAIFDPAVYYGHREMDIGMTLLFGGFTHQFYEVYQNIFPLQPGWRERVLLTQLYPLLVHAILFGGSYISQCTTIIKNHC
jgi:fructosamine-3-kinase